jgi:hypothetical protein
MSPFAKYLWFSLTNEIDKFWVYPIFTQKPMYNSFCLLEG